MVAAYPRNRIAPRLVSLELSFCVRLSWKRYSKTPLGCIPAKSRFCDGQSFGVLYCAPDFETAFHSQHSDIDGILFSSRLTGKDNYAIFERASHKLAPGQTRALKDHPELLGVLDERNIDLL